MKLKTLDKPLEIKDTKPLPVPHGHNFAVFGHGKSVNGLFVPVFRRSAFRFVEDIHNRLWCRCPFRHDNSITYQYNEIRPVIMHQSDRSGRRLDKLADNSGTAIGDMTNHFVENRKRFVIDPHFDFVGEVCGFH